MSELENQEVEVNPVGDLIDALAAQNFNTANDHLNDILGQKMSNALDAEKVNVASQIFNEPEDAQLELELGDDYFEEEDVTVDELDDEEI